MSTLHICHWKNIDHFRNQINLIHSNQDSIVIFGSICDDELEQLSHVLDPLDVSWHLVLDSDCPHIMERNISHKQWLELMIRHENSYAWK